MGVIFFTLLAVALGYGVGSKTRKAKKHQGENQMQDTGSIVGHREEVDSPAGWGSVLPDRLQEKRKECPEDMEPCRKDSEEETPVVDNKGEGSAPVFSLREAVIAQTVLERKYN